MEATDKKVVIIGAGGIGRHHARWWHLSGAKVCAHLGTSEASVDAAAGKLRQLFAYDGKGYTDLATMLDAEEPDWVDICSPYELHAQHLRACLERDLHVLCEKPFVYDAESDTEALMATTHELVKLAEARHLQLGLCSQYAVAAETCVGLFHQLHDSETLAHFHGELASPDRGRNASALESWVDLGPHLVASAQTIAATLASGPIKLDARTLTSDFSGPRATCTFRLLADGDPVLTCRLSTWHTPADAPASHVRRLTLNDLPFDLHGENDASGIYRSRIEYLDMAHIGPDTMHQLIERTLIGHTPINGTAILNNQAWFLHLASS